MNRASPLEFENTSPAHHTCGLVFCRRGFMANGAAVDVVAVWREPEPGQPPQANSTVYAMPCNMLSRGTECLLGCAVLYLDHLGIGRPRVGTIQRVAGMLAELSVAGGHKPPV